MDGGAMELVSTVGQLVGEEYRQLRGVGGQIAELRDELATMNAILRMQSEAEEGSVDHFVREWMKQVRELAYDAEDCVHLYIFRVRCRPRDGFVTWSKRLLATVFSCRRLAGEIEALRARAVAISERHARYGLSRDALCRSPSLAPVPASGWSAQALRTADDLDEFVGIRSQAEILTKLIDAEEGDKKLKVFSVVGFRGLGKTTLAMVLCRQLEAKFQRQAQVSVSQAFDGRNDLKGLLTRVLEQIVKPKASDGKGIIKEENPLDGVDRMTEDKLAGKIKEVLNGMRYLIVVDDVWKIASWEAIRSRLPHDDSGSVILVTTRIADVAKACSHASKYIYQIKPLNRDDSRKLFLSRAFGSMDASCPVELKVSMESILKKCGGLPLAIVSLASRLANYRSSGDNHMWERVCKSIGSEMESNLSLEGMRQILTLSYNSLPHRLKAYMMYLSIFPEDYVVEVSRLLYRWIAEGLVEDKRGLSLMEVAQNYLNELLNLNMIDRAKVSNAGTVETCRMHDMMLEVIVSKSLEANFVSLVGKQYRGMSYGRVRRLSVHDDEQRPCDEEGSKGCLSKRTMVERDTAPLLDDMDLEHVRSLTTFQSEDHKLLNRLGEFKLMRVLDLEDCRGVQDKHMRDVCGLYLLRFLSLKGTDIGVMPPEVGDLEHLQTLDVEETRLGELPETVTKLTKLENLMFKHKTVVRYVGPSPGSQKNESTAQDR